jgi:two-component system CheB/CheR fusion protein
LRLGQVFWNILTNAIKFSRESGQVLVSTTLQPDYVRVAVQDFGAGMSLETRARLFSMSAPDPASRSKGGLGLGLIITKGIVDAHLGRIRALSDGPGQGSTIEVDLPLGIEAMTSDSRNEPDLT